MLTCFMLADRLQMDVRVIADWPIDLIQHWVAYCKIAHDMRSPQKG